MLDFGVASTLSFPDGSVDTEDRYALLGLYSGNIGAAPEFIGPIGNISAVSASGAHEYDLAFYFSGATSYAIAPALETGWSFDTNTGLFTIDTDADGTFGPYTVTATNASGNTDSNTFTVKVAVGTVRAYRGIRHARGVRSYR